MGTRSLTSFIEVGEYEGKRYKNEIVTMYRQMDGYPSGMGVDLAEFLAGGKLANGISLAEKSSVIFNGMGSLAAQAVAHFKHGAGGYYLQRNNKGSGEEYRYHVIGDYDTKALTMKVFEVGYMNKKDKYVNKTRCIFTGTPADFLKSKLAGE